MTSQTKISDIKPKLVLGLGNPGKEYERTYHNAGFLFLDYLSNNKDSKKFKRPMLKNFQFLENSNAIFVKPLTFMNESGKGAVEALKYFKLSKANLIVAHDDVDLPIGEHRISFESGSAGHHGIDSLIKHLKGNDFWRVRFGIKFNPEIKASEFVLRKISEDNLQKLQEAFYSAEKEIFQNDDQKN